MSSPGEGSASRKRCTVAYATPVRQYLWEVELPLAATIAEALAAAREQAMVEAEACSSIPWETAAVGVFGEPRSRSDSYADGDRIELYRPLARDPRARRREQVRRERRTARTRGR